MPSGQRDSGSSGIAVEIEGLAEFMRDLRKFEPAVSKQFRARIKKVVDVVAKDAQRRAPRKTGKLARGIKPSVTNKGARLISKADHARIFEFGGRHPVYGNKNNWVFQPAKPHIFPAVEANKALVHKEALAGLDDAIREIGFRG